MTIAPGLLTALMLGAANLAGRLAVAMRHRREAVDLLEWDSHSLKDIGLTPTDVRSALRMPYFNDPTATLSMIAAGRDPNLRHDSASRPALPSGIGTAGRSRPGNLPSAGPAVCA